jgi:cob(I)alamin adenosyltransferase
VSKINCFADAHKSDNSSSKRSQSNEVLFYYLLNVYQIIEFIDSKPESVELILTGRYCPDELISKADLVTEMKEIKHYYSKGITSRKGIES